MSSRLGLRKCQPRLRVSPAASFALLLVALCAASVAGGKTDLMACTYTSDDGSLFDFSGMRKFSNDNTRDFVCMDSNNRIYYNICQNTVSAGPCQVKSAPAIEDVNGNCLVLGTLQSGTFDLLESGRPEAGVKLTYSGGVSCRPGGGAPSSTVSLIMEFPCNENAGVDGEPSYEQVNGCIGRIRLPIKYGCPVSGLSGGWIFVIIFLVLTFVYCVGGVIYNRKRLGKTGAESIPNVDFWRELPGLVKDGNKYFCHKMSELCSKKGDASGAPSSSSSSSYQTI